MPSLIKKVFSKKSSSSSKDRSQEKFTKLESPSVTTLGQDDAEGAKADTTEMKRKAWEAKRAREAEEYLARHGFVSITIIKKNQGYLSENGG